MTRGNAKRTEARSDYALSLESVELAMEYADPEGYAISADGLHALKEVTVTPGLLKWVTNIHRNAWSEREAVILAARVAWGEEEFFVYGASPTPRAARRLSNATQCPAGTARARLAELRSGLFHVSYRDGFVYRVRFERPLLHRTILVVDGVERLGTDLVRRLIEESELRGVKLVLVGSPCRSMSLLFRKVRR